MAYINGKETLILNVLLIDSVGSEGLAYVRIKDEQAYRCAAIGTCTDTDIIIARANYQNHNMPVTNIAMEAFRDCVNLTSVFIPDSVTSIGRNAFDGCSSLASVTIPNSITIIEVSTFANCSSLASVNIPKSVTSINQGAFYGCSSLTSVTIPKRVTSIGDYAFYGCIQLNEILYRGTISEWSNINKGNMWSKNVPATHVTCRDGTVAI